MLRNHQLHEWNTEHHSHRASRTPPAQLTLPAGLKLTWSEQRKLEIHAPEYLRNVVQIITETGLRVFKELMPMKKEPLDFKKLFSAETADEARLW